MKTGRKEFCAVSINGHGYVFGGVTSGRKVLKSVRTYLVVTYIVMANVVVACKGHGYVFCGVTDDRRVFKLVRIIWTCHDISVIMKCRLW